MLSELRKLTTTSTNLNSMRIIYGQYSALFRIFLTFIAFLTATVDESKCIVALKAPTAIC